MRFNENGIQKSVTENYFIASTFPFESAFKGNFNLET